MQAEAISSFQAQVAADQPFHRVLAPDGCCPHRIARSCGRLERSTAGRHRLSDHRQSHAAELAWHAYAAAAKSDRFI